MAGTLTISTLSDGTNSTSSTNCIQGSAKAWVNFNGVSGVSIRASYNISSITRGGAGIYTVNFTNAMVDGNYSVIALAGAVGTITAIIRVYQSPAPSTTSVKLECTEGTGANNDSAQFNIAIFR